MKGQVGAVLIFCYFFYKKGHACKPIGNDVKFLSPIPPEYGRSRLVQCNKQTILPSFRSVDEMLAIEEMNLLGLVHSGATKIWTVPELLRYFVGKKVLDFGRDDVKDQKKSTAFLACKENDDDTNEVRTFKRIMKILLCYTTSNLGHLRDVCQSIALMFGFCFSMQGSGNNGTVMQCYCCGSNARSHKKKTEPNPPSPLAEHSVGDSSSSTSLVEADNCSVGDVLLEIMKYSASPASKAPDVHATRKLGCPVKLKYYQLQNGFYHLTSFTLGHENHELMYDLSALPLDMKIDEQAFLQQYSVFIQSANPVQIMYLLNTFLPDQLHVGGRTGESVKDAEK
jgi:hypothetical protein